MLANDVNQLIHDPARLMIMAVLYVIESGDRIFLMRQAGLSWSDLISHVGRLKDAGYVEDAKKKRGKRPNVMIRLAEQGRAAFQEYCTSTNISQNRF